VCVCVGGGVEGEAEGGGAGRQGSELGVRDSCYSGRMLGIQGP
jgi:hypothetical protein